MVQHNTQPERKERGRNSKDFLCVFKLAVWDEEINDEFEDIVNEEDDESEDLAEDTTV